MEPAVERETTSTSSLLSRNGSAAFGKALQSMPSMHVGYLEM